jgi:hypothetical protein
MIGTGVAVAECPRPLPGGILEAIDRRLADELALEMVRFDAAGLLLHQSIIHELALSKNIGGATIGTVEDFMGDSDLAGVAFVIDGIRPEMVTAWGYLLRAIVEERRRQPAIAGPYLVVLMPTGLPTQTAVQLTGKLSVRKSLGLVSSIDTNAWVAAAGIRVGSGITERLAVATLVEVAAWSRDLLEAGLQWDTEAQLSPLASLHMLAGSDNWPFPCWENGLVDIWDDIPVPHAAAALAHGFDAEIERRVWAAQCRVLLPIFDAARRGIIGKYLDELDKHASVSEPYVRKVNTRVITYRSPWQFEWYEIGTLLSGILTRDEAGLVRAFKPARDFLSHAKAIDAVALHQLSEWWEAVSDSLTAPVPGWDWPRAGQCLSMTVGPAAGGKSTWAAAQSAPVVSTDGLRLELHGSLTAAGSQGPIFRLARAKATSILRSGSDVVLDATHLHERDRVRNAAIVPKDLGVTYVIIDRKLDQKIRSSGDRPAGLVEEHHNIFLGSIRDCLKGDNLSHVKVVDARVPGDENVSFPNDNSLL